MYLSWKNCRNLLGFHSELFLNVYKPCPSNILCLAVTREETHTARDGDAGWGGGRGGGFAARGGSPGSCLVANDCSCCRMRRVRGERTPVCVRGWGAEQAREGVIRAPVASHASRKRSVSFPSAGTTARQAVPRETVPFRV